MGPIERITQMLLAADTQDRHFPATTYFNEGWLLRLVLGWYSSRDLGGDHLNFEPGANWYSEALLPSEFAPRQRNDKLSEGPTHADGIIGHFTVGDEASANTKANTKLRSGASQFVVADENSSASGFRRKASTQDFSIKRPEMSPVSHRFSPKPAVSRNFFRPSGSSCLLRSSRLTPSYSTRSSLKTKSRRSSTHISAYPPDVENPNCDGTTKGSSQHFANEDRVLKMGEHNKTIADIDEEFGSSLPPSIPSAFGSTDRRSRTEGRDSGSKMRKTA